MGATELVARFAAGEPGSASEMYRAYGRQVYAVAYRVLGDSDLAEDATRRTFVQARKLAASFDHRRPLGPWLATIAGHAAIEVARDHRHRPGQAVDQENIPGPGRVSSPPSAGQVQDVWLVRRALDALSVQDRALIRLQHHERLHPAEISDRLAIPLGSVKSRSHQAHRRLADLLHTLANHASLNASINNH